MPRWSGWGYGELDGRVSDDGSDPPCALIGGAGAACGAAAALVCCLAPYRATSHGNRAQGAVMPLRLGTMTSRPLVGT